MAEKRHYQLSPTKEGRLGAQILPSVHVAIRMYPPTSVRRIKHGIHAQGVITITTDLGPLRARFVDIAWNARTEAFVVRWLQRETGQETEEGRPERLDVVGPLTPESRMAWQEAILGVFNQVSTAPTRGE